MSVVSVRAAVAGGETASDSFYLTILDAEGWVWEQSWFLGRQAGTREEAGFKVSKLLRPITEE